MDLLGKVVQTWPAAVVVVALTLVAAVVRALLPGAQARFRRVAALLGVAAMTVGGELGMRLLGYNDAARMLEVVAQLLLAYTVVNLAVTASFEVLLPRLGLTAAPIVYELVLVGGWAVSTLAVLTLSGFDLASVAAASTVAVAILTISLQTTLGNVVGGVAIQLDRSIKDGDWLVLDNGHQGRVREVRWRHTVLETRTGNLLLVPNSALLSMTVEVVGRPNGHPGPFRIAVPFVVDVRTAPHRVIEVVEEALRRSPLPNVASEPPPDCVVRDLGFERPGLITFEARVWVVDPRPDSRASTATALRIHAGLRRAGLALGSPTTGIYGLGTGGEVEQHAADLQRRGRALLDRMPVFQDLDPAELDRFSHQLEEAPFCAGEILIREGRAARHLYLLAEGTVQVVREVDGVRTELAVLTGPTFFGERGLMTGEARNATVVARTDAACFRLDRAAFEELRARPAIAQALAALEASRPSPVAPPVEDGSVTPGDPEPLLGRILSFFRL